MTTELWKELHTHALNYDTKNGKDLLWLDNWSKKIPRFTTGCKCNEHWAKWYKSNPPDFTSSEKYFEWTVRAHNDVNIRLGKPVLAVEQVKSIYDKK